MKVSGRGARPKVGAAPLPPRDELADAREQQQAVADVLEAIATATTDPQHVFDTILRHAVRLTGAEYSYLWRFEGDDAVLMAQFGSHPAMWPVGERRAIATLLPSRRLLTGLDVAHIPNVATDPELQDPARATNAEQRVAFPTRLAVAIRREGRLLGSINAVRGAVRPFSDREIELVRTFARQAAIAIENVRLFNETKEALERQTATAEVLEVISRATTDLGPVYRTILEKTLALGGADIASLLLRDGDRYRSVMTLGFTPDELQLHAQYFDRAEAIGFETGDRSSLTGRVSGTRRTVHIPDTVLDPEYEPTFDRSSLPRTLLGIPLLREEEVIGVLLAHRRQPKPYSDHQIALLETFARQAAIAIENVRLFNETKESLEQQTAVAEVLEVISRTTDDLKPVFEAIVEKAISLIGADNASLLLREGERYRGAARAGSPFLRREPTAEEREFLDAFNERQRVGNDPGDSRSLTGRVTAARHTIQIPDTSLDPEYEPGIDRAALATLVSRTLLGVPLLRNGEVIGVIIARHNEPKPFTDRQIAILETFAHQAAIAIENVRLFNETKEALERQTATSEILQAISTAQSRIEPVFQAIVERAARLCEADMATASIREGESYLVMAGWHIPEAWYARAAGPQPISRGSAAGRCYREERTLTWDDVTLDAEVMAGAGPQQQITGARSVIAVPILVDGGVLGVITLRRTEVRPFTPRQIELVEAFAAQAAIAIENVRLFNETKEALEQQRAVAEVLKTISQSVFDLQPVLDAVVENAARLAQADVAWIASRSTQDTRLMAFSSGITPEQRSEWQDRLRDNLPSSPPGRSIMGRVFAERSTIHVADILADPELNVASRTVRLVNGRTVLAVPILRDGAPIAGLILARRDVRPFSDREIGLVQTFADQAGIAIANTRLFNETKESLDQQTALAGILQAISSSPTEVQPVLDAIASNAARFCAAEDVMVLLRMNDRLPAAAHAGSLHIPDSADPLGRQADANTVPGLALLEARTVHVPDLEAVDSFAVGRAIARIDGVRSVLAAPLLSQGSAIGVIFLRRLGVRPFSDRDIALVETFASQAVIAIENVRLFNETKEALEHQTAIADVLEAISSSPTDVEPVLDTIAKSAARICDATYSGVMLEKDGMLIPRQTVRRRPNTTETGAPFPIEGSVSGAALRQARTIHVEDILATDEFPATRASAQRAGNNTRTVLAVPLIRQGHAIGTIFLRRNEVRPFSEKEIELIKTFAGQAVIAIENVRLFNETKEALEQQSATRAVLETISAAALDLDAVFKTIVENAVKLCAAANASLSIEEHAGYRQVAHAGLGDLEWYAQLVRSTTVSPSRHSTLGRVLLERKTVQIDDIMADPEYDLTRIREMEAARGRGLVQTRTILGVPIKKGDRILGVMLVRRNEVRRFDDREIEILETFADQAAIAIENVRLFNETKEALERQTAISAVLEAISGSSSDLRPVFDTIVERATALCHAEHAFAGRIVEGGWLLDAYRGSSDEARAQIGTVRRMTAEMWEAGSNTVNVPDALSHPRLEGTRLVNLVQIRGFLWVPLRHEGDIVGVINLGRSTVGAFSEHEVRLVETFAHQAAIAIENVRLFNETKEALERQTATSEVLKVISTSTTDLAPVLQKLVETAGQLLGSDTSVIFKAEGERLVTVATHQTTHMILGTAFDLSSDQVAPRAFRTRSTVHIPDISKDPAYVGMDQVGGPLSRLAVPIVTSVGVFGVITAGYTEPRPFSPRQIELIETFAAQAAIAIENVRLFNETQEALERQTATAELLKVISQSTTDLQPVFDTIVQSVVRLCDADYATFWRPKDDGFAMVAGSDPTSEFQAFLRTQLVKPDRGSITGRALLEKQIVHFPDVFADPELTYRGAPRPGGALSALGVPILRGDEVVGLIGIGREEVRPFNDAEIALVQSFADQALIAIENVRLFNETKEALERQTATSEVLGVISRSTFDLPAVFDAMIEKAVAICRADYGSIYQGDDEQLRPVAQLGGPAEFRELNARTVYRQGRDTANGRALLEKRTIHIPDWRKDPEYDWAGKTWMGSLLVVPMIRDGHVVGTFGLNRAEPRPFSETEIRLVTTFADQAVIAIENVRLFNETKEALDQQSATRAVLEIISAAAFDLDKVFTTIAESAVALCHADNASIVRADVGFRQVAHAGKFPHLEEYRRYADARPAPTPGRGSLTGRVLLERRTVQIEDKESDPEYDRSELRQQVPGSEEVHTMLGVPILKGDDILGILLLRRLQVKRFTDREVAIVETFAQQLAIAMENVRLFNETKEALEQQTATSDLLKVISASTFDLQPVLDAVVEAAGRLARADGAWMRTMHASGLLESGGGRWARDPAILEQVRESERVTDEHRPAQFTPPESSLMGSVLRERRTIHVEDIAAGPTLSGSSTARHMGARTCLAVPVLRQGEPLGFLILARTRVEPFTQREIQLVETFANQAAIAIENVRLFNETKEALGQQTAISDVLKVISRSAFDLQPVLDIVVERAARLCEAEYGILFRRDGERYHFGALYVGGRMPEEGEAALRAAREVTIDRGTMVGRVTLEGAPVQIVDVQADPEYRSPTARLSGAHSLLGVPLLREGVVIGVINVARNEVRPFTEKQVQLVQTFAAQAVIAIENVRLFNETKEALAQQTAVGEVLQTISRSVFDLDPILATVVENAVRLCHAKGGLLFREVNDEFRLAAIYGSDVARDEWFTNTRTTAPGRGNVTGRALLAGAPVQILDAETDPYYESRKMQAKEHFHSLLGVPLIHKGRPIGAMSLFRDEVRAFSDDEVTLVQTFADQAAIAIENARLFNEITEKSRELEVANQHKSEFLATMSHELRTPLNAIIGFSEVLLQRMFGELNEKQEEYLRDVLGSGKHLLTLINDILDISKVEAGKMELEPTEFSLPAALSNGVTMVRERAANHAIALSLEVVPGLDVVSADERKVKQIVYNLLSNAVKFTPDGGSVAVNATRVDGEVRVAVRDTGIGIAPEDQHRVFEAFQQAAAARSREGTGLGLALTKKFVELHGGTIRVESTPGAGSTFTFTLPGAAR